MVEHCHDHFALGAVLQHGQPLRQERIHVVQRSHVVGPMGECLELNNYPAGLPSSAAWAVTVAAASCAVTRVTLPG